MGVGDLFPRTGGERAGVGSVGLQWGIGESAAGCGRLPGRDGCGAGPESRWSRECWEKGSGDFSKVGGSEGALASRALDGVGPVGLRVRPR